MNISKLDQKYVWHPFTQLVKPNLEIPITRARGSILYGEDGKEYIDGISSWWVNLHGHAHPYITERITKKLNEMHQIIFAGFTHESGARLAEELINYTNNKFERVFYSDNGSTSVEVALKMAIQWWALHGEERDTFIALEDGYHGDTFGAMSISEDSLFTKKFKKYLFKVKRIKRPISYQTTFREIEGICAKEKVAGIIFEPLVQGSSGMKFYEDQGLKSLLQAAKELNLISIADEVMTGFYRLGVPFSSLQFENLPDICCLSKGLTGGTMPLGVTLANRKLVEPFLDNSLEKEMRKNIFLHGHSFTGNPLACEAARASLELLKDKEKIVRIGKINEMHSRYLLTLKDNPKVFNLRVRGTILAFEVLDSNSNYSATLKDQLVEGFLKRGVLLRPLGNTVYILPPYCITDIELQKIYSSINEVLDEL